MPDLPAGDGLRGNPETLGLSEGGGARVAVSVSGPGALQFTVAVDRPVIELGDSTTVTTKLRRNAPITPTISGGC